MNWYYASGGKPIGPVSDADWAALVAQGTIQAGTLVWHEGLENWQPFSALPGATPDVAAEQCCDDCGQAFPAQKLGLSEGQLLCAACAARRENEPASVEQLSARLETRDYQLSVSHNFQRAWQIVKANLWPAVGVTLLGYVIMLGLSRVPVLGLIATFCVQPQMTAGLYWYFLKQIRGRDVGLGDLFEGFRRGFAQQAVYMLIVFSIIFAVALPVGMIVSWLQKGLPPGSPALSPGLEAALTLGAVVLGLGMMALLVSWTFAPLLILDQNLRATEAMRLSQHAVRRVFGKFVLLLLALALLAVCGALALVVGIIFALPVVFATLAQTYEDLFGRAAPPSAPEP